MNSQKKIILLSCYYGPFPWYFNYFVHSCKHNPSIDFYIITDNTTSEIPLPANVKLIYKTLDETRRLASKRLGFKVKIGEGYKFCDFKPAYGFIFADLIKGYDVWGYADIDIIFGNIRDFATDAVLNSYDLVSIQPYFLTGCFLLFKNNKKINALFKHSKDYRKVFSSEEHYCFDETNYTFEKFNEGLKYHQITTEIESMTHVVRRLEEEKFIRPYFDLHIIEGEPGNIKWENGKMTYKNKFSFALYHLINFKSHFIPKKIHRSIPDTFTISPNNIYHKSIPKSS